MIAMRGFSVHATTSIMIRTVVLTIILRTKILLRKNPTRVYRSSNSRNKHSYIYIYRITYSTVCTYTHVYIYIHLHFLRAYVCTYIYIHVLVYVYSNTLHLIL